MERVVRIPVRVARASRPDVPGSQDSNQVGTVPDARSGWAMDGASAAQTPPPARQMPDATAQPETAGAHQEVEWRDRALRLQAEMENYRKRQRRLAEEQIQAERERLLRAWLPVVDGLERAMATPSSSAEVLLAGIRLIHRTALQILNQEGVEPIEAEGLPFDPNWHEAVATATHDGSGEAPGTVLSVVQAGYRAGNRLIRPAGVIVAS